jgi:DNA-binding MarR family transcriptional regulator
MNQPPDHELLRGLANFRYALRRFLRFSEKEARSAGVTPQQHQLLLGIAGFSERGVATISQLAEFLQERNNSVVGLVERAASSGLVRRRSSTVDQRQVLVSLTPRGRGILLRLSRLHREEVGRVRAVIVSSAEALETRNATGQTTAPTPRCAVSPQPRRRRTS